MVAKTPVWLRGGHRALVIMLAGPLCCSPGAMGWRVQEAPVPLAGGLATEGLYNSSVATMRGDEEQFGGSRSAIIS